MQSENLKKKIAVVIVNYNGINFLEPLFQSLDKQAYPRDKYRIIVVDNASTDGSLEWLRNSPLDIEFIENKENFGFARGNNIGIKDAIERGADYVYLLNQDTEVSPDFLIHAIKAIESNSRVGSAQSLLLLHPEINLINSDGNIIHYLGFGYCGNYREGVEKATAGVFKKIAYGSGAGILYKTEALQKVGLFDKDLFMYHEDLDLGWRLRMAGYENILATRSVVYHKYDFSRSIKKYYWMERNRYIVLFQNYKCLTIILILPALIFMEIGLFIFSLLGGWWNEKIKVYKFFLNPCCWFKIFKKRFQRQCERKAKDKEIIKYFSGKIEFQEVANPVLIYFVNPVLDTYWKIVKRLVIW